MSEWMISVDDHVLEPPHVWESRLPVKYRDVGPRFFTDEGGPAWHFENKRLPIAGTLAVLGREEGQTHFSMDAVGYSEMREGSYDPKARLADMTEDGVLASACYPTFARFCGQTFYEANDRELGMLCIKAYNDWMIDEWCAGSDGRLVPLVIMPLWDPRAATAELERCASKGARAFSFSENPSKLGLPSLYDVNGYWDPVIETASEAGLVFGIHIGSSSWIPASAPDAPHMSTVVWGTASVASCGLMDWMLSGKLKQFPKAKLLLSEGGVGWIPYFLERANRSIERHHEWANRSTVFSSEDTRRILNGEVHRSQVLGQEHRLDFEDFDAFEYFRRSVIACAFCDTEEFAFRNIDEIGVDNVTVESDYPHGDTSFPNSLESAKRLVAHLPADDQYKVLQGNARRWFDINPVEPTRARSTVAA